MPPRNYRRRIHRTKRFNANNANNINRNRISRIRLTNNTNTLDRIARIIEPQITHNLFEQAFFNGTNFNDTNNFESLILPAGCLPSSLFP
ncbi:unnamed protein product [Rhizophagus irregularis]|uniref:Uncharacterized protein n=1 Tax=Rhizophagus irregularis TaxID=588596 RepID=A0A916EDU3_9GLOM|nr:unnamed protein product [Rhizophagus irregularis]CAB5383227.1 unnamed protein product [Rhizophagus irregularis]